MNVLMIGFGNVGRAAAKMLSQKTNELGGRRFADIRVVGIITRKSGALVREAGIDPGDAVVEFSADNRFSTRHPAFAEIDAIKAAAEIDYDVLVEMSPLSVENHGEPALTHVRTALNRGRHVVTANKGPVAFAYGEVTAAARRKGGILRFESTVMDGMPIFNMAGAALADCRVTEITGILNSTSNCVLTGMEQGLSSETALEQARAAGIAEADASLDLEGWDAAAKVAILACALMDAAVTPLYVDRTGVTALTPAKVRAPLKNGRRLKLLCRAKQTPEGVKTRVSPEEIPADHPLAGISGTGAAIVIETDSTSPIIIVQPSSTVQDTAYGVVTDIMSIGREMRR